MAERRWQVADPAPAEVRERFSGWHPVAVDLLYRRGIAAPEAAEAFLDPQYDAAVHDPFLFRDMQKAVDRLVRAIKKRETITIHGDYDADGVDASALLYILLKKLGAVVDVFLPHREDDGYGIITRTVEMLAARGTTVMITCDCGIANRVEIARGNELGIDTIITDHHAMPAELPDAHATIHPLVPGETYPDKGLAGGGVAFKLACALLTEARKKFPERTADMPIGWEKWLLEFAAISSIGDVVPLLGETRAMVKYGLIVLNKHRRPGMRKLLELTGHIDKLGLKKPKEVDSETVAFQICPRINAAGRMHHAEDAFRLLTSEDDEEATVFAQRLQDLNKDRQKAVERMMLEARRQVVDERQDERHAIVVAGEDWPAGLVGLVAGRIAEQFYRPTFALGKKDTGWVGSGRGIPEFDMMTALNAMPDLFVKYGGHPQACGFTVKPDFLPTFRERMSVYATTVLAQAELLPTLHLDAEVRLAAIGWELHETLQRFQPFGEKNPEPRFLARRVIVSSADPVGKEGAHVRLSIRGEDGVTRKTIGFRMGEWATRLTPGDTIDVAFTLGTNEWNGKSELQLKLVDLRPHVP